jgi:HK97 family phage prohead protease
MEIKEISAEGTFEGLLSVYNNIDLGNELVEPGAFTKTIQEHGSEVPLLWQHRPDVPIGKLLLQDGPDALRVTGQLLMDLPDAQKAYLLIKAKIVKGLSIGFDTIKDAMDGAVRRLKELRLYEGSIVTFPMNELALITQVKGRETKDDFNSEFAEQQLQDAGYQMRIALFQALGSIILDSTLTRDEKISATEVTIQQFADAYMAFLPAYLDWLNEQYGGMETASRNRMERKDGRRLSGATRQTLKSACDHMKNANDLLFALLEDEAEENDDADEAADASESKAVNPEPEPGPSHSAAKILDAMRSLIPAAQ